MHVTIKDAEKVPGLTVRVDDVGNIEIDARGVGPYQPTYREMAVDANGKLLVVGRYRGMMQSG